MIVFNGMALENIAPVKIEDIRVSPIIQTPVARDRPITAGMTFVRSHEGTRTVSITFAIIEQDLDLRQKHIEAVTAWALSDKPAPMLLPFRTGKYIEVICTGLPEPSTRQWWESRLNLTFTAYDPYFYDLTEKSAECGNEFTVRGNALPKMRIEATLDESGDLEFSDGTNTMEFEGVAAGDVVIDLNRQTAKVGSTSIMDKFTFTSRFIPPKLGTMTITGDGTVKWREAWKA